MNQYYKEIMALKEAEEFKAVVERWRVLSENMQTLPTDAPIVLPDMLWIARSGVGKTNLLRLMCEYLSSKPNLMDFYGDVKFFEFLLDYCPPDRHFTALERLMDAVNNAAGFRSEFRGVVHINVGEWLDHYEEENFVSFMEYLALNSDQWLIVLSLYSEDEEKLHNFTAFLSMYIRLERVALSLPKSEDLLDYVESVLGKYGLSLDDSARHLLCGTMEVLRNNKYFDGFKSIRMLCQDIAYAMFSKEHMAGYCLTAAMLEAFSADSDYVKRTVANFEKVSRIGFGA